MNDAARKAKTALATVALTTVALTKVALATVVVGSVAWQPTRASAWCQMTTDLASVSPGNCPTTGTPLRWERSCITYALHRGGSSDFDNDTLRTHIETSFNQWLDVECSGETLNLDAVLRKQTTKCDTPEFNPDSGNTNAIIFVQDWSARGYDPKAYALTTVWHNVTTGEIRDVDMEINEERGSYTECPNGTGCSSCDDTSLGDLDGDDVADACDLCPGADDYGPDSDNDGMPNLCDLCGGGNDLIDSDADGVPDGCDLCQGFNDAIDSDSDNVPNACDTCNGGDTDGDGRNNNCDLCPGFDDTKDDDGDGVPDGCDICNGGNDLLDSDLDGVPNDCDLCSGYNDDADSNSNGIPDGCELEENIDLRNVITHEAGHFFGLGHTQNDTTATMFAVAPPGEIDKRTLSTDDIEGMCAIYPPTSAGGNCDYDPAGGFSPECGGGGGCSCSLSPHGSPEQNSNDLPPAAYALLTALYLGLHRRFRK